MSPPPSSADKPPSAGGDWWRFTWEAQSHTSVLRLLLFNPSTKPSAQCRDLKLSLLSEKSLLTVSFLEGDGEIETLVSVSVPRVLIDPESPLHFRLFDDHIEVKLVLLLPVDHPLVSDFDSIINNGGNDDLLRPISVDADIKKLSCLNEVHFYCRNCSVKLTKGLRSFREMPSVNWREVADNWFGNCCCSFGGVSEKLVAEYVKSYTCAPGVCLLNATSLLLCKNDILGCEIPDVPASQNVKPGQDLPNGHSSSGVTLNEACEKEDRIKTNEECGTSKDLVDDECLSCTFSALQINENKGLMNESIQDCHIGCCTSAAVLETSSELQKNEGNVELLENQKMFLDGYLGNGFMVRSSELSKDISWIDFLCPRCSCLVGAYPCLDDKVPLDGGIRLFKCYISTGLPSSLSDDAFWNYTLERMFASQLLESAEDELSFRTIVRDIQTKSPVLQIVVLNPNSWGCSGIMNPEEPSARFIMYPTMKVLFSSSSHDMEFDSRTLDEWATKNQVDEIYMFSSQILELVQVLELANSQSPPSCRSLEGLLLSSMRR